MPLPPAFTQAGLTPEALAAIDQLAVGSGGFVRELLTFTSGESRLKADSGQRLSAADAAVDQLLRERLLALFPTSSGFSEEGGEFGRAGGGLRLRWSVDPLDGTRPALLGGAYAISLGVLVLAGDRPVAAAGWVYVPNLRALYRGMVGEGFAECLLNGRPVQAPEIEPERYGHHYLAVGSDWSRAPVTGPFKLSAPGATAVHLTQLVHPDSDLAAAVLSRYKSYDAIGGLVIATAGGCEVHLVQEDGRPHADRAELLYFLQSLDRTPGEFGPRAAVGRPEILQVLRQS